MVTIPYAVINFAGERSPGYLLPQGHRMNQYSVTLVAMWPRMVIVSVNWVPSAPGLPL